MANAPPFFAVGAHDVVPLCHEATYARTRWSVAMAARGVVSGVAGSAGPREELPRVCGFRTAKNRLKNRGRNDEATGDRPDRDANSTGRPPRDARRGSDGPESGLATFHHQRQDASIHRPGPWPHSQRVCHVSERCFTRAVAGSVIAPARSNARPLRPIRSPQPN